MALIGLERASDWDIWCHARDEGFVIVSKDSDYYELSLLHGAPPKVIWLKTGNTSKGAVTRLLLDQHSHIEKLLNQHDIHCAEIY